MDIDQHKDDHDLKALEHRLAAWRPSAGALDRDRMLYDAGRAAARGEGHIGAWRLTTAALVILSLSLGGMLAQQRSLLRREQSGRMALEMERMARTRASPPAPPVEIELPPIEPPAPSSYFALTSRFVEGLVNAPFAEVEHEAEQNPPDPTPSERLPQPAPLRPRDIQRVLDL